MATVVSGFPITRERDRFFSGVAIAMALTVIAGFSLHYLAGRSTFEARPIVHVHALAFMGWVGLFTVQAQLGAGRETPQLHRRLGWLGAAWAVLLVVVAFALMIDVTRRGTAPYFFRPQQFLIANCLGVLTFAGFTVAAIRMRHRTDWHRRLHVVGTSMIMGPAFGRLLPSPLLQPLAFEIASLAGLVFPAAGMMRDWRRYGRVHPAWIWAFVAMPATLVAAYVLAFSPIGAALYAAVTSGSPGAAVPGLEFAPPPPGS
jgi:hypothetical protein